MNFATIASPDWVTALNICNVNLGDGIRQGNEYVLKNIFTGGHSYHSLRYLPHKNVFMNHCESGSDMRLTPVKFIAKYKVVTEIDAWILLKKSMGKWNNTFLPQSDYQKNCVLPSHKEEINNKVFLEKDSHQLRSLQKCWLNETYKKRCELLTLISANLENTRNVHASSLARDWWQDRGFDPQFIAENLKSYVLLVSPQQLENLDCVKQMTIEEKYLTGIWKPHAITGKPVLQWISKDYLALFFCWNYLPNPIGNRNLIVTGIRARYTSKGPTQNPKEVTLGIKHIKELDGYPAGLGYYGLLVPKVKDTTHTSWSQLHGCQGFTVILTEGCCDMLAGRHLIRGSNIIWATSGQIQTAMWHDNLRLIQKCERLIIAFNNDNNSNENTGQKLAQKTKDEALKYGIKTVEILPIELLNDSNDLNDLLKNKKASGGQLEALENFCKR